MSTRKRFETLQTLLTAIETLHSYQELPSSVLNAAQNVKEEFDDELNDRVILSSWHINDVQSYGEVLGFDEENELTETECRDILHTIERRQDADIGINWNVIAEFIDSAKSKPTESIDLGIVASDFWETDDE